MEENKKSQTWSIDVALGVIIFMAAFFIAYSLLDSNQGSNAAPLKKESLTIINQVTSEDSLLKVVENNELSDDKMNELKDMSYDELKRKLRAESEFCIYMEDSNGNIIPIDNSYKGIGSPEIIIGGTPCSQR